MTITEHGRGTSGEPGIDPTCTGSLELRADHRLDRAPHSDPGDAIPDGDSRIGHTLGVAGLAALVLIGGVSLGIAVTSHGPLGIVDLDAPASSTAPVAGIDGLAPGGPARVVRLPVPNPGNGPLTLTGLVPQLAGLPAACPAGAWRITLPSRLPVLPGPAPAHAGPAGGSGTPAPDPGPATVPLTAALTADAPESCQALAVPLHVTVAATTGGAPTSIDSVVTLATARLGGPGALVSVTGGQVRVLPSPPVLGPAPTGYTVDALNPDGTRTRICPTVSLDPCLDTAFPRAVRRGYLVTAHAGSAWQRDAAAVQVWTPPPTPLLTPAGGSAAIGPAPALTLAAPPAAGGYRLTVTVDGGEVFQQEVTAEIALDRTVRLPGSRPGRHVAVAVATVHGTSISSVPLTFRIAASGALAPA